MRSALGLAERGRGLASPNPMVGAVLVAGGEVVGEGWHEGPGTPHAEVLALRQAGVRARGATLYVTLEPCAHHGRTPPCAPAVADAGVARVVAAMGDPNPLVDGAGFRILRQRGVDVAVGEGSREAAHLNRAFLRHVRTGRPYVTLKMAASLDGKAAARDGSSKWITGEQARMDVHLLRSTVDAIVVGAGTAVRDDPALTARHPSHGGPPKLRVVVDGRGIVPDTHQLFDGQAPTLVATTRQAREDRRAAWSRTAEVLVLDDAGEGLIPLEALMQELGKRDLMHVLVEGGPTLAWEAVARDVVDEVVFYFAPVLVGGASAPSMLMGDGMPTIGDARDISIREVARIGPDIKVVADVHRDR